MQLWRCLPPSYKCLQHSRHLVLDSLGRRGSVFVLAAAPKLHTSSSQPPSPKRGNQQQSSSRQGTKQRKGPAGGSAASSSSSSSQSGPQRLSKVLAAAGVASRRASEELIAQGVVKVNGEVVVSQVLVDPGRDTIEVRGKKLNTASLREHLVYFALNKPKGYICSNAVSPGKEAGSRAVDLLQPWLDKWAKDPAHKGLLPPRLFTVGRLDVATTGLLFITNDGHWANSVIHPSFDITKEYFMLVDKAPSRVQLESMMRGVEIDGVHVAPEEVSTLEESVRLRVVVNEGKKHQVRLLAAAAGLEVLALKRVRVGGFRMPRTLRLGEFMSLTPAQLKKVTDPRAQQSAAAKPPSEQKAPVRLKQGLPDPETLAAMLEGKIAATAGDKKKPPPWRPPASKDDL